MARHLKTRILHRLKSIISKELPASRISTLHTRGVRYLTFVEGIDAYLGAMNTVKEGRKYHKHIIVRHYARHTKLFQFYTYHFPKKWSAACVANRELIKEAQRRAHALEKDCSPEGLEWRIRFFKHYFTVCKGKAKPETGMKPYSRFYQYTYVAIYRQLKEAAQKEKKEQLNLEDISFEPIDFRPKFKRFASPLRRAYNYFRQSNLEQPDIQIFIKPQNIPRTTEEFAYVEKKQYLCTEF